MHKHTIDWIRQVDLTANAALAEKRWGVAEKTAKKLNRARVIELLRLFLFPTNTTDFTKSFTEELVGLDPEFRVTDNIQHLRLMAGLVMVSIFDDPSHEADAFALGIRAASFPSDRVQPVQPAMVGEAEQYLIKEAGRLRLDDFATDGTQLTKRLAARAKAVTDVQLTGDPNKQEASNEAFRQSVIETISEGHTQIGARLQQLAEEQALLWWVFNEYSDGLQSSLAELSPQVYALAAASEAAKRTHIIPPPPCIGPLLERALRNCKTGKKTPVLADYVEATTPAWRANQAKTLKVNDCHDLVPLSAAIEKAEELGDVTSALKAIPKLCPGVSTSLALSPIQAAQQFYNELVFLRALSDARAE